MRKRFLLLAIVPVVAVAVVATTLVLRSPQASAESLVPFHATVSEMFTAAPCGSSLRCITAVGTGQATHLGEITENATVVINTDPSLMQNGCSPETRDTKFTAANGDTITMHGTGWTCAATSDAHDSYGIAGGSGRFQGASGSGNEYNVHTFTGQGVGVATVTYDGVISSVGSLNS